MKNPAVRLLENKFISISLSTSIDDTKRIKQLIAILETAKKIKQMVSIDFISTLVTNTLTENAIPITNEEENNLLIDHTFNPDLLLNEKEKTLVFYFSRFPKYIHVLELLIELGANVNKKSIAGFTPLIYAINNHNEQAVDLLIQAKAEVNVVNDLGATPLIYAAQNGLTNVVKKLIHAGATVDYQSKDIFCALVYAAMSGKQDCFELLLNHKLMVNASDAHIDAFNAAATRGHIAIMQKLVQSGLDINSKNKKGWTALLCAVEANKIVAVNFLLEHHIDLNLKSKQGDSALDIAIQNANLAIISLLLEHGAEIADKTSLLDFIKKQKEDNAEVKKIINLLNPNISKPQSQIINFFQTSQQAVSPISKSFSSAAQNYDPSPSGLRRRIVN